MNLPELPHFVKGLVQGNYYRREVRHGHTIIYLQKCFILA